MLLPDLKTMHPSLWGRLFYFLLPIRRSVVLSNMGIVYGQHLSQGEIRQLAQCFYSHLARCLKENFMTGHMSEEELRKMIRVEGLEHVLEASKRNKGIIFLTGHFGNWELSAVASALHFPQFRNRFHVIRRSLVNKTVERIVFRRFYEAGVKVIPKKNSLYQVLDCLSQNDVVIFIMDQYAKPGRDGLEVDFFGKKIGTFKSLSLVARSSGASVIPMSSYREKSGRHVMLFSEPLSWIDDPDPDQELLRNTRCYNEVLERLVLMHPDQWLWLHRRWKVKK